VTPPADPGIDRAIRLVPARLWMHSALR